MDQTMTTFTVPGSVGALVSSQEIESIARNAKNAIGRYLKGRIDPPLAAFERLQCAVLRSLLIYSFPVTHNESSHMLVGDGATQETAPTEESQYLADSPKWMRIIETIPAESDDQIKWEQRWALCAEVQSLAADSIVHPERAFIG